MNNNNARRTFEVTSAAGHVLALITRGFVDENAIRAELAADPLGGQAILAASVFSPGRELDQLESAGLIAFVDDVAHTTAACKNAASIVCR